METRMAVAKSNLAVEKDKFGVDVEIHYCQMIGGTPNLTFFLSQFVKLIENGHAHPHIAGTNRSKAVYATINNKIVGQITFEILDDYSKTTWITLSSVDEEFRGRGIYTMLHKNLESLMLELGSRKLASHVHLDNQVRLSSARKAGMKPVYYRMEKDL
jgi:RimJ/RimL family protein N-acetyltransferase